ncbi:hypothetical protein LOD99_2154 [Oopsacas minuta]|uniref:Tesmin/TSO1-like CXC domain-containing protein n=1 Tax=Oopsacas minuta TaxID=111878 RepID=A0AAV7K246_9METZ|nr:hypothetical protein LOD99_2154 [Oopsacas minuta]
MKTQLMAWMRDNNTSKWSYGIRFVQWSMDTSYHEAIGMESYKAMTGIRPRCGLKSILPTDFLDKIFTGILEEDLEIQICEVENGDANSNNPDTIVSPGNDNPDAESNHLPPSMAESSLDNGRTHVLPRAESSLDNERTHLLPLAESSLENESTHIFPCTTTPLGNNSTEEILSDLIRGKDPELHHTNVSNSLLSNFRGNDSHPARRARIEACKGIQKQAKKMIARSIRTLRPLRIGDSVAVPVSQFDRSKGDPPNISGIVLEFDQRGYQIGTRTAKIRGRFARNQVEFIKFTGLNSEHIPDEELSIREIVRAQSICGGPGFRRCHCKSNCLTKRCSCLKAGLICNSACHGKGSCDNID